MTKTRDSQNTPSPGASGKRPYHAPSIKAHGNIRDITRSTGNGVAVDGSMTKSV
jgi:hypothetical protein